MKFKDYKLFVAASKKDSKLEILSEQNNTYRSLIAMLISVGITKIYELLTKEFSISNDFTTWILLLSLLILFIAAYKKQSNYITSRIDRSLED